MGNILASNREWTQHQNEDEDDADQSQHYGHQQDENVNPSTPVVESTSRLIKRKLSAAIGTGTAEYIRVAASSGCAGNEATPVANNKVVLGSNFDPRSPTTGIVRFGSLISSIHYHFSIS